MADDSSQPGGFNPSVGWQRRLDQLSDHLLGLESQMHEIRQGLQQLRAEVHQPIILEEPAEEVLAPVVPVAPPTIKPVAPHPPTVSQDTKASGPAPAGVGAAAPTATGIGSLEAWLGGAWLAWLGALCVLLGAGWFFQYAIQHGWISPWLRVSTGWAAGAILLGLGQWSFRRQMPWFAAGVTGAGIGLGYIAGYAASPLWYGLISLSGSYAVLSAVTAIGLLQAVQLRQLSTAVLALLGGFLTLVLLKSPHPTAAGLLGYLLALSVGALGSGQIRRWPALRYLAWAGSALMVALWLSGTHVRGAELGPTLSLLAVLFALYQLDLTMWRLRVPEEHSTASSQLAALNGAGFLLAIYWAVQEDQVALIAGGAFFAVAAFQIVLGGILWTVSPSEQNRRVAISLYGQASLAAAVGLPVAFDRFWLVLGWSAQALTIAWFVRHVRAVWLRLSVAGLLIASIIYIIAQFEESFLQAGLQVAGLHLSGRMWLATAVTLAAGTASCLLARWYSRSQWWLDRSIGEICALLAAAAGIIGGATLLSADPHIELFAWMSMSAAALLGALAYRARYLRLAPIMLLPLLAAASMIFINLADGSSSVFASQPWQICLVDFGPLLPAGLVLAALALWNAWLVCHARTRDDSGIALAALLVVPAAAIGLIVLLHNQFSDDGAAYAVLAITAASAALAVLGYAWVQPLYAPWGSVIWLAAALYWIGAATIGSRFGGAKHVAAPWTSVAPFANTTFLAALVLIAAAWLVSGSLRRLATPQEHDARAYAVVPLLLAAYLLLHALSFELDRWCQIHASAMDDPAQVERVALSVLWALLALTYVVAGLLLRTRSLRLMGLVLFAITAGKVLLLDMAQVAALYRVLGAMGLGVLSLAGSYAYQRVRRSSL